MPVHLSSLFAFLIGLHNKLQAAHAIASVICLDVVD